MRSRLLNRRSHHVIERFLSLRRPTNPLFGSLKVAECSVLFGVVRAARLRTEREQHVVRKSLLQSIL